MAAEDTVLPSMDTTPCRGAIYLPITKMSFSQRGEIKAFTEK
jgi:hypothetical protein